MCVLWDPVAQFPLSLELSGVSCIDFLSCPVVTETLLLSVCQWVGLSFRVTGCENWPRRQELQSRPRSTAACSDTRPCSDIYKVIYG